MSPKILVSSSHDSSSHRQSLEIALSSLRSFLAGFHFCLVRTVFFAGFHFFGLNRLGMFFAGLHVLGLYPSWNVFAGFHFFGLDKNQQKKQKCKFEHVGPLKPCFDRPQPTRKTQFLTSSNFQAALVVKLFANGRWHGTIH